MLGILKEVASNYELKIMAFCLMPNHVHLLLQTATANLREAMRDLFSRYARLFNKKYERKGHLFGGPYRQAVCLDESYLLAASLYIHLNPVKAGLTSNPLSHRWSSVGLYSKDTARQSFVQPAPILSLLSPDMSEGRKRYCELLRRGSEVDIGLVMEEEDAIDRFRRTMIGMFPGIAERMKVLAPARSTLAPIETLERQIEEIKAGGYTRTPESKEAKRFLIEQLIARGYTRSEIAIKLGLSRKTLYNLLKNLPISSQG